MHVFALVHLSQMLAAQNSRLLDAGSRRRSSRKGRFVGSHPLAGSHQRGPQAADPTLFEGKLTVLTPVEFTPKGDIEAISAFWQQIGAQACFLSPSEHDQLLASASHAPHIVAAAPGYCNTP